MDVNSDDASGHVGCKSRQSTKAVAPLSKGWLCFLQVSHA